MRTRFLARRHAGFTTLEVLVAVVVIAMVVVFTGRVIIMTLTLVGSVDSDFQKGARARTQAAEWTQGVIEYTRDVGRPFEGRPFGKLTDACPVSPCVFWIPATISSAAPPYNQGPALPAGFQCGYVLLSDWDGVGPLDPNTELQLITVAVYRVKPTCSSGGTEVPFVTAHTGVATR